MAEIIAADELIAYPGSGNPTATNAAYYVELVNALVTEAWTTPAEPVPTWVKTIALEAASRASSNPKRLQSITRSADDGSRTERYAEAARAGVFLTKDEARLLRSNDGRPKRRGYGSFRSRLGY